MNICLDLLNTVVETFLAAYNSYTGNIIGREKKKEKDTRDEDSVGEATNVVMFNVNSNHFRQPRN